jgi:HEAT repeat protein
LELDLEDIAQLQDDTPETSPEASLESNPTVQTQLDWHQLCRDVLEQQLGKQLFSRQVIERGLGNKDSGVYVPLGVVKPKLASDPEEYLSRKDFLKRIAEQGANLAIVGNSGTGKSTWLEQIALHLAEEEIGFPICIPASALRGKTLQEYLLTDWLEEALPYLAPDAYQVSAIEKGELRRLFGTGNVWLLVDAIDEMSVLPGYDSPLEAIASQFSGWPATARIVLTCRLNLWQRYKFALPNFHTYHTVDFDNRQVNQFISLWFEKAGTQALAKRLQYKLSESEREPIQDLAKNPLFLSMVCGVWLLKPEDFPKSKAELYRKFIENFYKWKEYKLQIDWSQQQELNTSLAKLALIAFEDSSALKETKILKILGKTLFEKACTVGWLVQVAKDSQTSEPIYSFLHFSFQENFAAEAIAKNYDWHFFLRHVQGNPWQGSYCIFEPKWWNIYIFWKGKPSVASASKSALLRALVTFEDESGFNFYRWRAYFIAAAGLPEFRDCPSDLADEIASIILKLSMGVIEVEHQLFRLDHPAILLARTALFWIDANRAVDFFVSNLSLIFEKEYLQKNMAKILKRIAIGNSIAVQFLSQLLLKNPDKETKIIWVNCLGEIGVGDSKAIFTLTKLFHQSSDEPTRLEIAESLIKVDPTNECAIAFLLDQVPFKSPQSSSLAGVNDQIIINLLIQRLNNATDGSSCLKFATLLSLINPKEALFYLQKLLDSPEEEIRLEAALTLQEISPNNPQAIQTLNNFLNCENNNLVYEVALRLAIINPGSTEAQDAFTKLLTCENVSIVIRTARQWRKIKANSSQVVNILLEILCDDSEAQLFWKDAVDILSRIAAIDRSVTKAIIELLSTRKDEEMQELIAWYLGEIVPASSESIKALIECLSFAINVRCQAVVSLGQVGERNCEAISALISLLQSSTNENLRRKVVKSLGKIGFDNLNAIRALEKLLDESEDEETCFLAACTLSQTSTDKSKAIEVLKKLISSSQSLFIQSHAAIALWQQVPGDINILETLIQLLLDNRGNSKSIKLDYDPEYGYGFLQSTIAKFLKNLVFTDQLPIIINTIQSYRSRQDAVSITLYKVFGYSIIWHYAQNLPYDKFYQACRGE